MISIASAHVETVSEVEIAQASVTLSGEGSASPRSSRNGHSLKSGLGGIFVTSYLETDPPFEPALSLSRQ
jgi:hypothetical protein